MSPEPVRLSRAPSDARVIGGSPAEAAESIVAGRLAASFERGREAGRVDAELGAAQALGAAAGKLDDVLVAAREEVAGTAVELALEIAGRLLRSEIDAGRYDLETIVREALKESGVGRASCRVHLNPADLERLEGAEFRGGTELVGDPAVPRGDVHVETADGLLVREMDRALESVGERIRGDLE